jgi:hypothetical protein
MPYIKNIKQDIYFNFEAKLYYNPTSNNLLGVDARPKYYIEPGELKQALYWSEDSRSLDRGYHRDASLNFYIKNIYNLSDREVEQEYFRVISRTPFSYTTMKSYQEYGREVYSANFQGKLEQQFRALFGEGKVVEATTIELSHSVITCTHTISEFTKASRSEFYVPSCAVIGLSKI